ncbi:MAG TPA: autotransporter outer membrane beta-barrel domain-containing protein [Sedimentisphaerales bacterium]|jgi:hypothetical protein|nr:autotransporter outer membrane beta-barrel domain-containing protein [Sedimentisphaerales bacterium]HNU29230.1 autotransporter outer membrane beta-barrel domain-containing protein [Sedimentisphaerales bacterium]
MQIFTKAERSTGIGRSRQFTWAIGLAIACLSGAALGQVDVNETGLHDANSVYGIDGSAYTAPWTNSQSITLFAWGETDPNLYYDNAGFYAYGIDSNTALTNTGPIAVTGTGGNAYGIEGSAYANIGVYGLYGVSDVSNSAAIGVDATGGAATASHYNAFATTQVYGISAGGSVTNSGAITIEERGGDARSDYGGAAAYVDVYGIFAMTDASNSGEISITAYGGGAGTDSADNTSNASTNVYGIYTYGGTDNTADLTVRAIGGFAESGGDGSPYASAYAGSTAYGIYSEGDVNNTGDLTVIATTNQAATLGSPAQATGRAYGIHSFGDVHNEGDISVISQSGTAETNGGSADTTSIAYGIEAYGNVTNSGNITVTSNVPDGSTPARAYGIRMYNEGYLTNTGIIRAIGDSAYELFIDSSVTTLLDTYNVTLDGDPNTASIYVGGEAMLVLNDATLTVTAVDGETLWNTEYRLFEASGLVSGSFGQVQAVNPDVTATYYTQGTEGAEDDTVSLSYAPEASEALASSAVEKQLVSHAADAMNRHMTSILLESMLEPDVWEDDDDSTGEAALGGSACQRASGMFIEPYYSHISKDARPLGYNAGQWGTSTGYTQCVGDSLLGLHVGYGSSDIDYTGTGYSTNSEDQGIVTTGFSGLTRWRPWALRYGFTTFYGWHDYEGLTGLNLDERETASYNSYGGNAAVALGRTFRRGMHVFYPEIGATYLWTHRERYTTDATDASWDTTYSAMNDHDLVGEASLFWQSRFMYRKIRITPSASIGIRQLLTDGETEIWQSVVGADRVRVESDQDETAVALAGSLVLRRSRSTLTLAYDGEYSSDVQRHDVWMRFKWLF